MKSAFYALVVALCVTPVLPAQDHPFSPISANYPAGSAAQPSSGLPCQGDQPSAAVPPTGQYPRLVVQSGHARRITAMTFSPHNTILATGSEDGTVRLWWVTTGQLLRTFEISAYWVHSLAFSPNGCMLAIGSGDNNIYVEDINSGAQLKALSPQNGAVKALAFSPDGGLLASGGTGVNMNPPGALAVVWEVGSWRSLYQHKFPGLIHDVAFLPQAKTLVIASGKHLVLWNYGDDRVETDIEANSKEVVHVFVPASGAWVVSTGSDSTPANPAPGVATTYSASAASWRISGGKVDAGWNLHYPQQWAIGLTGDGNSLVALATGALGFYSESAYFSPVPVGELQVGVCPLISPECQAEPHQPMQRLRGAALSPNGRLLAFTTGQDIHFGGLADSEQRELVSAPSQAVTAVRFSGDGELLAAGLRGGQITVWDKTLRLPAYTLRHPLGAADFSLRSLDFDARANGMVSAGEDGSIVQWTLSDPPASKLARPPTPSERRAASLASREELGLVRPEAPKGLVATLYSGEEKGPSSGAGEDIFASAASGAGVIAYGGFYYEDNRGSKGGFVSILSPDNSAAHPRITDEARGSQDVTALSFSPVGGLLAIGFEGGGIDIWSTEEEKIVNRLDGHRARINALAFSPNGELLASASTDKTVRLWNPKSTTPLHVLPGHTSTVLCLAFSIDDGGAWLASGSADNKILVWNVNSGALAGSLEGHSSAVNALAFHPQRKVLVSGGEDGTLRFWDTSKFLPLAILLPVAGGKDWLATTLNGFFDGAEESWGRVLWQFNGNLFDVSPVEIGFRDFFIPNLLPRVVEAQPPAATRPLVGLNRAQPAVRIKSVTADSSETVRVDVEVENGVSLTQRDERGKPLVSGVYDLRIFRNGQLVDENPKVNVQPGSASPPTLEEWRRLHQVEFNSAGQAVVPFEHIRLPMQTATGEVYFTAYAFNRDRVKSLNSPPFKRTLPPAAGSSAKRAFLITMGVNANQSGWNLDVAVTSAEQARRLLHAKLLQEYPTVVDVPLYSDLGDNGEAALTQARKTTLRAVLDLLSGRPVDPKVRDQIDSQHRLTTATPDDAVVLYVASHGYADPQGTLYLVPYETGPHFGITEEVLTRCLALPASYGACQNARYFLDHSISSSDLSSWWQDVDAGELVMILDSCHSGAAPGKEFRPGPLGDPGLGQLSYDKRMRLFLASQPTQTDLGDFIGGGGGRTLLMEALAAVARDHPTQSLPEWLKATERQLPIIMKRLYPNVKEGDLQLPLLFDFGDPASFVPQTDLTTGGSAPQPAAVSPPTIAPQPPTSGVSSNTTAPTGTTAPNTPVGASSLKAIAH